MVERVLNNVYIIAVVAEITNVENYIDVEERTDDCKKKYGEGEDESEETNDGSDDDAGFGCGGFGVGYVDLTVPLFTNHEDDLRSENENVAETIVRRGKGVINKVTGRAIGD